ncbi:MAG TPA: hypothetical protein VHD87_14820 [Acidimicrobiales bacterium]|nr:hypothetical protein [Acidimicrobiales bacterium]
MSMTLVVIVFAVFVLLLIKDERHPRGDRYDYDAMLGEDSGDRRG